MPEIDVAIARLEERVRALEEDLREVRRYSADNRKRLETTERQTGAVKALADTIQALPGEMRSIAREAAQTALADGRRRRWTTWEKATAIVTALGMMAIQAATLVIAAGGGR